MMAIRIVVIAGRMKSCNILMAGSPVELFCSYCLDYIIRSIDNSVNNYFHFILIPVAMSSIPSISHVQVLNDDVLLLSLLRCFVGID
jgi:hypothetical protein